MKLNSKLPIIVIGCTIALFLGLSINNSNNKPQIETLRGHIRDLDDINIKVMEYDSSIYYNVTHSVNSNNEVTTTKEKKSDRYFENQKYIELLDISCGQDYISNVGYEIDYSEDKNQIYFIVDERKSNRSNEILANQGKNEKIINKESDLKDLNRTKIKLEYPEISPEIELAYILGSYRYKGELYIISNYTSKYSENIHGKNNLVISKINKQTKQLQEVVSIDLKEKVNIMDYLSVAKFVSYNDKIYALIVSNKYDESNDEGDKLYLLEYDLSTNESLVNEIDINRTYNFKDASFENNKINLVLANTRKDVELIFTQYNLVTKEKDDEFKIIVESKKEKDTKRNINNTLIKGDKIYITVGDNSTYGSYKTGQSIYVIDKDNKCITYKGKISGYEYIEIE